VAFTALSFGATQFTFNTTVNKAVSSDVSSHLVVDLTFMPACQTINQVYDATNAQLFATSNANIAYGCAAQYNNLNTLVPNQDGSYDRRGWIVKTSYIEPIDRLLIQGSSCNIVLPKSAKCSVENYNTLLIQTPPTAAAATLSNLGLPVKYYSPPDD
jgi:hypothetical protein